jgi:predicted phage terminase large subunit-like protein
VTTPGELARLELARRYRLEAEYPTALAFERRLDPRNVETPALRLLSDRLTLALRPRSRARLILAIPPQEGKSSLSRAGVLRELGVHPDQRFVLASYGLDLARDNSRAIRDDLVQNAGWLGIRPKYGRNTVTNWGLQGFRGGIQAAAPGSALVGKPADAVVIDDPFSGAAEASNKDRRDAVWKWWSGTVANRLSTGAPVVLIMTRWHDDDLAGRLLRYSTQPWDVLTIPAQCYDPGTDPLGRREGEFMVSAQGRDRADWETRKAEAGDMWWALFQGSPRPDTGKVFDRSWWQTFQQLPLTVDEHGRHWLTGFEEVVQSWDLTFGDGQDADYVVGQVWARRGSAAYLVDQVRERMDYPAQYQAVEALRAKWPQTGPVLIEKKANGAAVISTIAGRVPGIVPINPTESKLVRARAVAAFVKAGNCHIPDPRLPENVWVAGWVEELGAFDKGVHDDQVDAFTQAAAWFYQPILREQAERAERERMGSDRVFNIG